MKFELSPQSVSGKLVNRGLKEKILATNERAAEYGLKLSDDDAAMLVQAGRESLQEQDRVEFGRSATTVLIEKFMQSSYVTQSEYAVTVATLLDVFYEVKEESLDILSDEEVIDIMFDFFEHESGGSVELLQGRDMDVLCRKIRREAMGIEEYGKDEADDDE